VAEGVEPSRDVSTITRNARGGNELGFGVFDRLFLAITGYASTLLDNLSRQTETT